MYTNHNGQLNAFSYTHRLVLVTVAIKIFFSELLHVYMYVNLDCWYLILGVVIEGSDFNVENLFFKSWGTLLSSKSQIHVRLKNLKHFLRKGDIMSAFFFLI